MGGSIKNFFDRGLEIYNSIHTYFVNPAGEANFLGKIVRIVGIIIFTKIAISFMQGLIESSSKFQNMEDVQTRRRARTIRSSLKNIIKGLLCFYAGLSILEIFNIDTKSIIATAGIGGIAIGFGAQSLVKDMITGFFILQDDLYAVGDYVSIRGYEGTVEQLGLRITKLRDQSGELHIIPNGEVHIISNSSRGGARAMVHASIAYEEDLDQAIMVLENVCDYINMEFKDDIVVPARIRGVDELNDVGVEIRLEAMVEAMSKWDVERAFRKKVKEELEKSNIEIPYPRLITYGRDEI